MNSYVLFRKFYLLLALCGLSFITLAQPTVDTVPGGLALIPVPDEKPLPEVYYNNRRVAIINVDGHPHAMVGIPLSTKPGQQSIKLLWPGKQNQSRHFAVYSKQFESQYLTIKNKRKVNPTKEDMKRIEKERIKKARAKRHWSDNPVKTDFIIPVNGRISSNFGLRRFFNNQPRRPHSGLDIAAPEGTPIKAMESGTVIEADDFFFSGNMVYLDHGQGLISLYAHMHSINVKPGDHVEQGQVIGSVGQTGRVTGAHLHLAVMINQTTIDPGLLLPPLKTAARPNN
ncbi:MAG: peptidoglycan DD-metalloendopeptidase family protein [Gammaproteobacteria bacterium]|nr:peptidoglycan DD-metalloendopeptidase family protein [Gammaproteobacteria bacterium]